MFMIMFYLELLQKTKDKAIHDFLDQLGFKKSHDNTLPKLP